MSAVGSALPTPAEAGQSVADAARALLSHLRSRSGAEAEAQRSWLLTTAALVARLYASALLLPDEPAVSNDGAGGRPLIAPVQLQLGVPRAYFRHADPRKAGTEEVGDLEEDFEDLLGEVTRGLSSYEDGTPTGPARARAHWRRTLPHWGHHAVEALRVLHYSTQGLPG